MAAAEKLKVRMTLRKGGALEALTGIPAGQSLATYLARGRGWLNLTSITWDDTGQMMEHMALQVSQILWATQAGAEVADRSAIRGHPRRKVELVLESGASPTGELPLTDDQRLSDYLTSAGLFVPFFAPQELTGESPREVAVNRDAILGVRELSE